MNSGNSSPQLEGCIQAFGRLGGFFAAAGQVMEQGPTRQPASPEVKALVEAAHESRYENPWFTTGNLARAFHGLSAMLNRDVLEKWVGAYPALLQPTPETSSVAVIMAGNIPLVGFHDALCILISGHRCIAKLSSHDRFLFPAVARILRTLWPGFHNRITCEGSVLQGFDAVIATGSNNTARYFDYHFGQYPHLIRRNRNSLALITGNETAAGLRALGEDVFSYFGLGCRNVSHLMLPTGMAPGQITKAWAAFSGVAENPKYLHNLQYYRALLSAQGSHFTDAGFFLLRQSPAIASPVGIIHYSGYSNLASAKAFIQRNLSSLQCVVGPRELTTATMPVIPAGSSQRPMPWDYPDGTDTIQFLLGIPSSAS